MRVPILPPPGLVSDSTDYAAPGVWSSGSNVRFFHGAPQAIGGESAAIGSDTYTRASKLFAYKIGSAYTMAVATDTNLWRVDLNSGARNDITPAAGWVAGYGRSLAMFGDILLAVSHNDTAPSSSGTLFQSTAGAQAVAAAGAPANINCMLVTPSRQVMALGCNEEVSATYNGRCIRWSDIGSITTWNTASSNNAGEYILPGQENIVGARLIGDYIVLWTAGSIYMGQYIGQPGQTYIFTRIGNIGLLGLNCHAEYQGVVYWMAPDYSVYRWAPGSVPDKIECPCSISVIADIVGNAGNVLPYRFHACTMPKFGEIWFFYPNSASVNPNKYLAFCVNESTERPVWFTGSMAAGAVLADPLIAASGLFTGAIRIEYDSAGAAKTLIPIDRTIGTVTYPSWSIQSSFYYLDEAKKRVQIQQYIADSHGTTADFKLSVLVQDYPESSPVTKGPFTISASGVTLKSDFRASGRIAAVKFHNGTTPGAFRLGKPVFEVVALGNR